MAMFSNQKGKSKKHKTTPLGVEQLEARLMYAVDGILANLQLLASPNLSASTPVVSNTAPTVATSLRLTTGSNVPGRTATLSVLGSDNGGETNLKYTWSVTQVPSGGQVTFAVNSSNAAKSNTLSFNKVGLYTVRVTIRDVQGLQTTSSLNINVVPTLTSFRLNTSDGRLVANGGSLALNSTSQAFSVIGLDQFGAALTQQPAVRWQTVSAPTGSTPAFQVGSSVSTVRFNRAGSHVLRVEMGTLRTQFTANVSQVFTSVSGTLASGTSVSSGSVVSTTASELRVTPRALDQFGQAMTSQPSFIWRATSAPTGVSASLAPSGNVAVTRFTRAGDYGFSATASGKSFTWTARVTQVLASVQFTATTERLAPGESFQFVARGLDQFQQLMATQPTLQWRATGGTVSSAGRFTAGTTAGNFTVTAVSGSVSRVVNVQIAAPAPQSPLRSTTVRAAVQNAYADSLINRTEMIGILRSAGGDGTVDANEFADFQYLVSSNSTFTMPVYVRELAKDVVGTNPANQFFKGQALGNLSAGSTAARLNNLVDKWFLGADDPALTNSSLTYRVASGNLFNGTPSRSDAKQGMLGDCYFIASLVSIADKNPNAVRNLFIDNQDGTFTVRFFAGALGSFYQNGLISAGFVSGSGVADYVTVSRKLPTYSNGTLAYSGYGLSSTSASTSLWIALAEKAYAQWNETRNAGRDGTNRYAAIEGGWMSNVNAQVLGYNSTNYSFSNTSKQTLIDAISSNRSVTLGTVSNASAGGLVGGHAYIVTGYNATNDTFTLHNPWGFSHPSALTWSQLTSNCSMFTVTNPAGSPSFSASQVRSGIDDTLVGCWTVVTTNAVADSIVEKPNDLVETHSDDLEYTFVVQEELESDVGGESSGWSTNDGDAEESVIDQDRFLFSGLLVDNALSELDLNDIFA